MLAHLKDITGPSLDPLQIAYRANRSVDDAVNMGLHYVLQHLDRPGTYVRILFVYFSSAFNTIIPNLLLPKLTQFSVPTSIRQWINSFMTDRQQLVRLDKYTSSTRTISTGAPQGCVLSPLLFSLFMNDRTSKDPSVKLLKFADYTTLIGLIQDGDESAYRQEVKELAVRCILNNLELNTLKTVEMIVDFRRTPPPNDLPPLTIMNSTGTAVESFRFLGTTISQDLKWDNHIDSIVKKAQQRLYILRQLRKFNLPQELLKQFYSTIIESVLCTSITVWFSSATKSDLRRLRRVVRTAERIISTTLPTLQELYSSRVNKRAGNITLDPSHHLWSPHIISGPLTSSLVPSHHLWTPHIISGPLTSSLVPSHHLWTPHIISGPLTSSLVPSRHLWSPHVISGPLTSSLDPSHHLWSPHIISGPLTSSLDPSRHLWTPHIISGPLTSSLVPSHHLWTPHIISGPLTSSLVPSHHLWSPHVISGPLTSSLDPSHHLWSPHIISGPLTSSLDPSHPAHSLFELLPSGRR